MHIYIYIYIYIYTHIYISYPSHLFEYHSYNSPSATQVNFHGHQAWLEKSSFNLWHFPFNIFNCPFSSGISQPATLMTWCDPNQFVSIGAPPSSGVVRLTEESLSLSMNGSCCQNQFPGQSLVWDGIISGKI